MLYLFITAVFLLCDSWNNSVRVVGRSIWQMAAEHRLGNWQIYRSHVLCRYVCMLWYVRL